MCGLPSCGKSTYIKKETNGIDKFVVISTDAIRAELCGDPSDQSHNKEVFELAHSRIKDFLNSEFDGDRIMAQLIINKFESDNRLQNEKHYQTIESN